MVCTHDKSWALYVLQYRTTVAKMLAKQANDLRNPAQFIITTFHPQIIHETDKVYGVSHQNRISRYRLIPAVFFCCSYWSCHPYLALIQASRSQLWSGEMMHE